MKKVMNEVEYMLKNLAIVLVRPKYPENVGFVARLAMNLGITQLVLVGQEKPDMDRMLTTATHNAQNIVASIQYHADLSDALTEFHLAVGTTARKGRGRLETVFPDELAEVLAPVLPNNKVALVFGPEDRGLTNDELRFCSLASSIPASGFTSFNLSHAAAIVCYEIFHGLMLLGDSDAKVRFSPRLSTLREQQSAFDDLGLLFAKMDGRSGKEKCAIRLNKMRILLGRRALQAKETRLVSEICQEIDTLLDPQ